MKLTSAIQRRFGRVAIALTLVPLIVLGSVAFAYASSPSVPPVEPNGDPVEPDGGIGN